MRKALGRLWICLGVVMLLMLLSNAAALGAIRNVPGTYSTIQAAITDASTGDTVLVADGTYTGTNNTNLSWSGTSKHITVKSSGGPVKCIINCNGVTGSRGFNFDENGQTTSDVIEGFTIKSGSGTGACAVYCDDTSPTIKNCIITKSNDVGCELGGIYCTNGSNAVIQNCTIRDNKTNTVGLSGGIICIASSPQIEACMIQNTVTQDGSNGGGIRCTSGSEAKIENCIISGNEASSAGGGIYAEDSAITVTGTTIRENNSGTGAGIYIHGYISGSPKKHSKISGCVITKNGLSSGGRGGGIACQAGAGPTIEKCTIIENKVENQGGGIFCDGGSEPKIENCIIANNTVENFESVCSGGGIYLFEYCNATINNCTIFGNQVSGDYNKPDEERGGGLACEGASPVIKNTIFYNNTDTNKGKEIASWGRVGASSSVTVSYSYVGNETNATYVGSYGSITWSDGVERGTDPNFKNTSKWDFRLNSDSPCKNAGTGTGVPENDRDDNARDASHDIGAYEYPASARTIHVPGDYPLIQVAMDEANDGDTIELADGTYIGEGNKNVSWSFTDKQLTIKSENGPGNCVIDCEGSGRAFYFTGDATPDIIEGLTIINGYDGSLGGGILCDSGSSPSIMNCIIEKCEAESGGGAFSCANNASPTIKNCLIKECMGGEGDAVRCDTGACPEIINCTTAKNNLDTDSKVIYCKGSGTGTNPKIKNCILWDKKDGVTVTEIYIEGGSASVTYSDVWKSSGVYSGTGNINTDPKFANPDSGKYQLNPDSPCIDKATDSDAPETDLQGNLRYDYPGMPASGQVSEVDMGVYETVPMLFWSSFLGGVSYDYASGIAVDSGGCVYVTGYTCGGFPTVSGSYDESFNGGYYDVIVAKFNADASTLVYSTHIGGNGEDYGGCIAVDSAGCAYVSGNTESDNLPTVNAYDSSYNSGDDMFVCKLNSAGTALLYSTYLGGGQDDKNRGLSIDEGGNAYVVGYTMSSNYDYPVTSGTRNGDSDVCVTKLNASGSGRVFSILIGGSAGELGNCIFVDSSGNSYISGTTASEDYPHTTGAHYGDTYDAFVTKLDPDGDQLVCSTFIGGNSHDYGKAITVDSSGCIYVTGHTQSSNFPVTFGAYKESKTGFDDTFVTKFEADLSGLLYSTLLGGDGQDIPSGVNVNSAGEVLVAGWTNSSDFPTTAGAIVSTADGEDGDGYLARFNADGSELEYSTILGGSELDSAEGLAVDESFCAYVCGFTGSSEFPTTEGAYDETHNGYQDTYVAKLSAIAQPSVYSFTVSSSPANGGSVSKSPDKELYAYGEQVTLMPSPDSGYSFSYWGGDASGSQNPKTITVTGNMNVTAYFVQNGYTLTVGVSPSGSGTVSKNPDKAQYSYNEQVTLTADSIGGYEFSYWSGALGGSQNPKNITMTGNASVTANFTYQGGCR